MRILARKSVALDVCPTSNLATGALPSIVDVARRVRALLAGGVVVTISTDDPGLFGTTLLGEFRKLSGAGVPARELGALHRFARKAALSRRGSSRRC
jgi:aminodeoxyfutalosine deaminase